ncbi:Sec-independent protein translocase protein TatC [compost metagenome]
MVLTPPDVFSQTLLAVPMWLLFETGVFFGGLVKKRDAQQRTAIEPESEVQPNAPPHP